MNYQVMRIARSGILGASAVALASCGAAVLPLAPDTPYVPERTFIASAVTAAGSSAVSYLSLPEGSLPDATTATIVVARTGVNVVAPVFNGGIDPIAIDAAAGDTVSISVSGGSAAAYLVVVPPTPKPPVIVRSDPPPNKRDVPLNASIRMVFSEPIDAATLTPSSIVVRSAGAVIAGNLSFVNEAHTIAQFTPSSSFDGNTDYTVTATTALRDVAGLPLASAATVAFTTGTTAAGPVASMGISISAVSLTIGGSATIVAMPRDADGNVVTGTNVTWSSSSLSVASVSPYGVVTAIAPGTATITARAGSITALLVVTVYQHSSRIGISAQASTTLVAGGQYSTTLQLYGVVVDVNGTVVPGLTVTWSNATPTIVSVSATGLVRALAPGTAIVTATWGSLTKSIALEVLPPITRLEITPASPTISQGGSVLLQVVGYTADNRRAMLNTAQWQSSNNALVTATRSSYADGSGVALSVGAGGSVTITATALGVSVSTTIGVTPFTTPTGTLHFTQVVAGERHACGLASTGDAYCWGGSYNFDGSAIANGLPTLVPGGLKFTTLAAGASVTCGIAVGGDAYCWGDYIAEYAYLAESLTPQLVAGGQSFTTISTSDTHSCALTASGGAWCWGFPISGQLGHEVNGGMPTCGDGLEFGPWCPVPFQVDGGIAFASISVGYDITCGVTAAGGGYCWGSNHNGQLGVGNSTGPQLCLPPRVMGTPACSRTPVAMTGNRTFLAIAAGLSEACGLDAGGAAYCWGQANSYDLGTGTKFGPEQCGPAYCATVPTSVAGGLTFRGITRSQYFGDICGVTTGGDAYCWGSQTKPMPTAVPGGLKFASVAAGDRFSCGLTLGGVAYCWGVNDAGQLGDGTRNAQTTPVRVGGQQ